MDKFYRHLLGFLLLCIATGSIMAQTTISGTVKDASDNSGLAGVNVVVKGSVIGTITNTNGEFNLNVNQATPITLVFSFIGFTTQEVQIANATTSLDIAMEESTLMGQEVVISASRVQESIMTSPVSIEKMDILDIRTSPSASFYDAIGNMKGVDMSAQGINFKSINARGFGANGNTRFVQLIDGIDNQAPGLNFSVGNAVGISELDLESAEMIPGAASALYGPNAIQGILLLRSKSPFEYQGLSAYTKTGINHVDERDDDLSFYQDYGLRYAKAFNNKFAFKVSGSYIRANDFRGVDFRDQSDLVERGKVGRDPDDRIFDGVNIYGEPLVNLGSVADGLIAGGGATGAQISAIRSLIPNGELGNFTPVGFSEGSFVDNTTESIKLSSALHYRLNNKIEISGQFNYGYGSTVYTANDRFVLDGFSIWTGKLELRGDNFYLRGYTTQEDAGDTYAANTVASLINVETYIPAYFQAFAGARTGQATGTPLSIDASHALARQAALAAQPQPGSDQFNQLFNQIRNIPISQGGAKFLDKSDLWHYEGSYNFSNVIKPVEIVAGANFRRYSLNSEGTLFALEDDGEEITIDEWGAYAQFTKNLMDNKLKLQGSIRYDKNENFDGQFSPRLSAVKTFLDDHHIRGSFQRGFRIPTTQDQFIDLDVVTRRLVGSNPLLVDRYRFKTNTVYSTQSVNAARDAGGDISLLEVPAKIFEEFKPETVNTFEIGYKGLWFNKKLFVDGYYYYSRYNDFIAEIDFTQAVPNGLRQDPAPFDPNSDAGKQAIVGQTVPTQRYGFDVNADGTVESNGWAVQLDYSLPKGYRLGGNVSYNKLISQSDLTSQGFQAQFNTPKYRYNLSFSNREILPNLGFNIAWRWQQAFLWESAIGTGVIDDFGTLDAQVSYKVKSLKSIFKLGGSNITDKRYTTSFANPSMGGIYYFQIIFDQFLN